jgi:pyridoxine 4-dehydrogenase
MAAALACTSAVAPVAIGRARRATRSGPARGAVHVRARVVDGDDSSAPLEPADASTSRRGLLLGTGGLAVATTQGLVLPGLASASPASSRATLAAPASQTAFPEKKAPYVAWSGTETNTVVGDGALSISPMGVGTWSWGNQFVWGYDERFDPELEKVFDRAVDRGITLFDTADSYGTGNGLDGRSEVLLGEFLRRYPQNTSLPRSEDALKRLSEVNIASKFAPYPWRITPRSVVRAARESSDRLGKESVELGQLHWSTGNYQPFQERALWDGLAEAYETGVIKAVGLSNYGPEQLKRAAAYMRRRSVPIATLQVQYHLLSRFPEMNGTRELCDALGIRLIAYSPLGLGLLTGKYSVENPPPGVRGYAYREVLPALPALLDVARSIGEARADPETGIPKTPAQIALNWCLCKDTTPIPGAKTLDQLNENLGALGWRLSEGEVRALDDAAAAVGKSTSQNIFQTR